MNTHVFRTSEEAPEEAEALLRLLQREAQYDLQRTTMNRVLTWLCGLMAGVLALILFLFPVSMPYWHLLGFLFFGSAAWAAAFQHKQRIRKKRRLIRRLGGTRQAIGPLLLMMHLEQPEQILQQAAAILKQHLPHLQAEEFARFTPAHIEALWRVLSCSDKELALATLKGIEQAGDRRAIEPVETLLAQTDKILVRRAATDCLAALTERAKHQEQAKTLLRASDAVETPADLLLRPTLTRNEETPQEQLLRPREEII